ncbi:MAG: hypothetical protein JWM44_2311 [Bacilli bacterium]|nr:hypothetical protein [Bacilli bacterium]
MSTRMTAAEYQEMIRFPKPSKMRNYKTEVDGIWFDSLLEANYYCELKVLIRTGEVKSFTRQPKYLLTDTLKKNGETFKKMYYIADFLVTYSDGREEIVDCKGRRTQVYINKRKLFENIYPHLTITEVSG